MRRIAVFIAAMAMFLVSGTVPMAQATLKPPPTSIVQKAPALKGKIRGDMSRNDARKKARFDQAWECFHHNAGYREPYICVHSYVEGPNLYASRLPSGRGQWLATGQVMQMRSIPRLGPGRVCDVRFRYDTHGRQITKVFGPCTSVYPQQEIKRAAFIIPRAHVAATQQHVEQRFDTLLRALCTHTRGWHCSNPYVPRGHCAWYHGPRRWTCFGGYVIWKGGVWSWLKGVLGFHVAHKHCVVQMQYRNYPLEPVWHWSDCKSY